MAAPPARARADYDYLIKLLLIGDSGKGFDVLFAFYFVSNAMDSNLVVLVSRFVLVYALICLIGDRKWDAFSFNLMLWISC